jgi:hypothetical protein
MSASGFRPQRTCQDLTYEAHIPIVWSISMSVSGQPCLPVRTWRPHDDFRAEPSPIRFLFLASRCFTTFWGQALGEGGQTCQPPEIHGVHGTGGDDEHGPPLL